MGKSYKRALGIAALAVIALSPVAVLWPNLTNPLLFRLIYATGNAKGCSYEGALKPIDSDIEERGWRIWNAMTPKRTDGPLVLWSLPTGEVWAPMKTPVPYLFAEQQMNVYESELAPIKKGDVVIDCGANIGSFAKRALERGASVVIAIEPSPVNIECLHRNLKTQLDQRRVIVYPVALWNSPSVLEFTVHSNSALDTAVMQDRRENIESVKKIRVPARPLDEIVSELGLARVNFIKMDIEGAEVKALEGAVSTLRRFHPRMAIASENDADAVDAIPKEVLRQAPTYRYADGQCTKIGRLQMRPEVIHFY